MQNSEYSPTVGESSSSTLVSRPSAALGTILLETARLDPEAIEPILRMQQRQGCLFGEAAIKLGLLKRSDVELALARQFGHDLPGTNPALHWNIVAVYRPGAPQVEALRSLRGVLSARLLESSHGSTTLAITSAGRREGRSMLVANLAVLFAQVGKRTLLIDADLREPSQHQMFGLRNRSGLTSILANRSSIDVLQEINGIKDLTVLTAGVIPPNPHELLARPLFPLVLSELSRKFDVVLIDTPAHDSCADAQLIARHAKQALVLARDNQSRVTSVEALVADLAQADVEVVGAVMNRF